MVTVFLAYVGPTGHTVSHGARYSLRTLLHDIYCFNDLLSADSMLCRV